jgi:uncharacterized protein (TIGR03437 family)
MRNKKVRSAHVLIFAAAAIAAYGQTPSITQGGIINAATFTSPVTPGSLISIFGSNLAGSLAQADSIPLSTSLNSVSVTINGIPAPLLFVSSGQINAQVPWEANGATTASVVVTRNGQQSTAQTGPMGPFAPGIFAQNNIAIAINSDGTIAAPAGAIPGITTHPAKVADPGGLVILCTGLGATTPGGVTGAASLDALRYATTYPTVLVGGQAVSPSNVVFAGLSPQFVGVNQVNVFLAAGTPTGNAVPLQLQVGGITTPNTVTIAVSQ